MVVCDAETTLWKSMFFIYNTLKIADEALNCADMNSVYICTNP